MDNFVKALDSAKFLINRAAIVKSGYWQGIETNNHPEMTTHELLNYTFRVYNTDMSIKDLVFQIQPDLPWADDHFLERVGRKPLNPPPSEGWWPHAPKGNDRFKNEFGIFSHTYPERYWPKLAGKKLSGGAPIVGNLNLGLGSVSTNRGILFPYGDLDDLISMMVADPLTRQAYLPVWFPEDLGAPITERKPCTLGYQFIMRDNKLHIAYFIRSCDFIRHFRNDIYLTARLQHWVLDELRAKDKLWEGIVPGSFTMYITSLHIFVNDYNQLFGGQK